MSKKWSDEELALLRRHYPNGSQAAAKYLPLRSRHAIKDKAEQLQISVSEDAKKRLKAKNMRIASKHRKHIYVNTRPRQPFDDVPPEYIKVGSIFRVGYRYASQVQA